MSYAFNSFINCPDIQGRLEDGYFRGDPTMFQGHINVLRAVTAPFNESGVMQRQIDTRNGKYRQVEVVYQPRLSVTDVSTSAALTCAGGATYGETSTVYNIDPAVGASFPWSVSLTDLAARCEADENYIARMVEKGMSAIKRSMNQEAVAFLDANFGPLGYGDTTFTTKTKLTNGAFVDDYLSDIMYQYELAEGWNRPVVVGGELSRKYMTALRAHCCATVNVDLQALAGSDAEAYFFFEPTADTVFGAGQFAFWAPGAVQLIRYNEFTNVQGPRGIDDGAIKIGTISDPQTGLDFDYYAQFDCGVWNFQLKLAYKFISMPEDMFLTNDNLSGVNYIFNGVVTNPA